ncbi:unnamed protein product [Ceratitis capitata]|uniref:(Mediterranean fruit fly) hypothetical protein n=1 Tax=Ceratitis capitata TaxID=7213 RepID=A0A811VGR8_CERCA|nr:unnamed protein product [Ceratitis capitata]
MRRRVASHLVPSYNHLYNSNSNSSSFESPSVTNNKRQARRWRRPCQLRAIAIFYLTFVEKPQLPITHEDLQLYMKTDQSNF